MDAETMQLAFEALMNLAQQAGLPPVAMVVIMTVLALGAGVAMFAFRFNPAGMVLTVLTLMLKGLKNFRRQDTKMADVLPLKRDSGSYDGPYPDSGADTRQPSVRLPPPTLPDAED